MRSKTLFLGNIISLQLFLLHGYVLSNVLHGDDGGDPILFCVRLSCEPF